MKEVKVEKVKVGGENKRIEVGEKFLLITAKVIFYVVVKVKEVIVKVGGKSKG